MCARVVFAGMNRHLAVLSFQLTQAFRMCKLFRVLSFGILFGAFYMSIFSCKEVGPGIDFTPTDTGLLDTTYIASSIETPQQKVVLLEEFTGVRCVNCPNAHEEVELISAQLGNKLAVLAIHTGFLAFPYEGDQDLRISPDGKSLEELTGTAIGQPAGRIDRKLFAGETEESILNYQIWENYIAEQADSVPALNIKLSSVLDEITREVIVRVELHYTKSIEADNYLTVVIKEYNIIAKQLGNTGIDSNYIHKHVLRDVLTPYNGILLNTTKEPGRVIIKEFKATLPSLWKLQDCEIVGFVHENGPVRFNVYQAAFLDIK